MKSPIRFYPLSPSDWRPFSLEYIGTSSYFFVYRHFRLQKDSDCLTGCWFILFFLHSISIHLAFCCRLSVFLFMSQSITKAGIPELRV